MYQRSVPTLFYIRVAAAILMLSMAIYSAPQQQAAARQTACQTFTETGKTVCDRFLATGKSTAVYLNMDFQSAACLVKSQR